MDQWICLYYHEREHGQVFIQHCTTDLISEENIVAWVQKGDLGHILDAEVE